MKIIQKILKSLTISLLIVSTFSLSVNAYTGNWTSRTVEDLNGVSQVGTTSYSTNAYYVVLTVYTSNHSIVGQKTTTAGYGDTVEHTCWGQPFLFRYGSVQHPGTHEPWFDV